MSEEQSRDFARLKSRIAVATESRYFPGKHFFDMLPQDMRAQAEQDFPAAKYTKKLEQLFSSLVLDRVDEADFSSQLNTMLDEAGKDPKLGTEAIRRIRSLALDILDTLTSIKTAEGDTMSWSAKEGARIHMTRHGKQNPR